MRRLFNRLVRHRRDAGMTTVEYAVCLLAGVAMAGVLYKVVTSPPVHAAINAIVLRALK
jgi:Flp pilus assembly pilin Flp